jgi:hypothetical protein
MSLCVVRLDCARRNQRARDGYSLCTRPIRLKFSQMFIRTAAKRFQRLNQNPTQSRQRVFYFRRHDRMNGALHQTVALEAPQGLGKHFLRNASDFPLQRRVTHRPPRENLDNESGPFIRDSVEYEP